MITSLHHPLLAQQTLRRNLQAALDHSILVALDGQCLAVAARAILQLNNKLTIFALSLDQFVCGGIIVSDKLLSGPQSLAGDWGHLSVPWMVDYELEGQICVCGRTGCLEHFVSLKGLSHDYEMLTGTKLTAENIIKKAKIGHIVAESAIQVIEDRVSRGLAVIIGLLDPDIILILGTLAKSKQLFTNIPRKWPGYIRSSGNGDILVPFSTSNPCHDHLYLHGAAYLCDYAK